MRFDDSLDTVLSADMSTPFGAQSAWRQLVDLIGRGRVPADAGAIAKLQAIRQHVPPPVRASSARALAFANPPAALVRLFFDDEIAIAAPVLRVAKLSAAEWIELLPGMSPASRSILRHRRDLAPDVRRALDAFGKVDFRLTSVEATLASATDVPPDAGLATADDLSTFDDAPVPRRIVPLGDLPAPAPPPGYEIVPPKFLVASATHKPDAPAIEVETPVIPEFLAPAPAEVEPYAESLASPVDPLPEIAAPAFPLEPDTAFVSVGAVARNLPVVAEALRHAEDAKVEAAKIEVSGAEATGVEATQVDALPPLALVEPPLPPEPAIADSAPVEGPFQISELVARIDAYQRQRDDTSSAPRADEHQPALFELEPVQAQSFRFETDAAGTVRWVEGAARASLIGLSLDLAAAVVAPYSDGRVDGVASGAFRRRAGFANARLVIDGHSDAAGQWRITGLPVFDRESGRFTGYRGTARRPRADESAEPLRSFASPATDALRQLVHELRTPTNAIAGFAEMIETQLLGPVPQAYRDQANEIRSHTAGLLTAIDDIDLAARLESHALDLRSEIVPLGDLLVRLAGDLGPLATLRGTDVLIDPGPADLAIAGDARAVERLIGRLVSTLVGSGGHDEAINIVASAADAQIVLTLDRPVALAAFGNDAILTIDAEAVAEAEGAPLLGTGFALRLARNLASELGGTLTIDAKALTLRLPAAVNAGVGQVFSN